MQKGIHLSLRVGKEGMGMGSGGRGGGGGGLGERRAMNDVCSGPMA